MTDNIALIRQAHQGDNRARTKVIEENLPLVWSVARRFQNRGYELEDLYQIGCIGLVKAIDNFDLNQNVCLSTYAVPVMIGEIKRFLRDDGVIKVSRSLKEQAYRITVAKNAIAQKYGREATIEEIAVATELSTEDVVVSLDASQCVDSLDREVTNAAGDLAHLRDFIPDERSAMYSIQQKIYVEQLMEELSAEERTVIRLRFFEDKTQTEIGELLNISQVQVSRMEKRAILKMRGAKYQNLTPNI